jgi:uncharacterized protein YndB with AHSA1/START domain
MTSASAPVVRARIHRSFASQAEDVFDAWIDPQKIREWFGPGLGEMTAMDVDPRVGGHFRLVQRRRDGDAVHTGEYEELERPRRLVFTWQTPPLVDRSRVHVEIAAAADGCALTLTHEMEAKWASFVPRIEESWTKMTEAMARMLERRAERTPPSGET